LAGLVIGDGGKLYPILHHCELQSSEAIRPHPSLRAASRQSISFLSWIASGLRPRNDEVGRNDDYGFATPPCRLRSPRNAAATHTKKAGSASRETPGPSYDYELIVFVLSIKAPLSLLHSRCEQSRPALSEGWG
jgi:hypothetical protein